MWNLFHYQYCVFISLLLRLIFEDEKNACFERESFPKFFEMWSSVANRHRASLLGNRIWWDQFEERSCPLVPITYVVLHICLIWLWDRSHSFRRPSRLCVSDVLLVMNVPLIIVYYLLFALLMSHELFWWGFIGDTTLKDYWSSGHGDSGLL